MNFINQKENENYYIKDDRLFYKKDDSYIDNVKKELLPSMSYELKTEFEQFENCVIIKHNSFIEKTLNVYLNDKSKLCSFNTREFREKGFSPFCDIVAQACDTGVLVSVYDYKNKYFEYDTYTKQSFKTDNFDKLLVTVKEYNNSLGIEDELPERMKDAPYTKMILDQLNNDDPSL